MPLLQSYTQLKRPRMPPAPSMDEEQLLALLESGAAPKAAAAPTAQPVSPDSASATRRQAPMPKESLDDIKALDARELAKGTNPNEIAEKYGSAISTTLSSEYARSGYPIENGRIDLHAWCVEKDGAIWDPDFPNTRSSSQGMACQ